MPANFEVTIKGVAACYYKPPVWHVLFPCDPTHLAKFKFGATHTDTREAGRVMVIPFPSASIPGPAPTPSGPGGAPRFNLAADYAHDTSRVGGVVRSNLWQHDLTQTEDDIVWLQIPNATLKSGQLAAPQYYVQDVTRKKGLPVELIGPIAREFVIEFNATAPIVLTGTDLRNASHSTVIHAGISVPSGGAVRKIEFDNDCHPNCPKENDFEHLYRIFYDENPIPTDRREFAAGKIKVRPAPKTASVYGNCDPVEIVPPPLP